MHIGYVLHQPLSEPSFLTRLVMNIHPPTHMYMYHSSVHHLSAVSRQGTVNSFLITIDTLQATCTQSASFKQAIPSHLLYIIILRYSYLIPKVAVMSLASCNWW